MKCNTLFLLVFFFLVSACNSDNKQGLQFTDHNRPVPSFNADSAYSKLVTQVEMGPRNPGSEGHQETLVYLQDQLKRYAGPQKVFIQEFTHHGYSGDTLAMQNIIAAFNTSSKDRIMLCAHWDTRPRAEQDTANADSAILGADDGASGVAVLLELARLFNEKMPPLGVDIILFDGEDYGKEGDLANYFVGSRFWSNYPPVKNYRPRFGILLDMVGGQNAQFPKEKNSMQFAPALVNELWGIADAKGHGSIFIDEEGPAVSDDHLVINRIKKIPVIDIIHYKTSGNGSVEFPPHWHTQNDDIDIIDKKMLKVVGEVLAELVYNRI